MKKYIWFCTLHQVNIIFSQFKWSFLESEHSRRTTDDEAEINVNDMTVIINEYVVVMTILDLKKILNHWIACKTLDKIWNTGLPVVAK